MYSHVLAGLMVLAQVEDPGLKTKALAFVEAMRQGDFAAAEKELDTTMKKVSPADKMREIWEVVTKQVGPIKKVLGMRTEPIGKYRVGYVACEVEKAKLSVRVRYDAEGRVAGYQVVPGGALEFKDPPYARRDAFTEKEVTIGEGRWALPGTLSLPKGEGPFPAVVLVHGSGPHDRDE